MKTKTEKEKEFCNNLTSNNSVQLFFQGVLIWYIAFNMIRLDKKASKKIDNTNQIENIMGTNKVVALENIKEKDAKRSNNDSSLNLGNSCAKEFTYVMFRPPLIAMFTGFVVGFITVIRLWMFNTKTTLYV